MFKDIVFYLRQLLANHHSLYSGQCKAEYWEELCSKALIRAGFGSDWKPDFNHVTGEDQRTSTGVRISNKGGKLKDDVLTISGSRLTKHKTLEEKVAFISEQHDDYVFCLATDDDWDPAKPVYYFVVIDSKSLAYDKGEWVETFAKQGKSKGKHNGWKTTSNLGFSARIVMSMSHQLWTDIDKQLFVEVHKIEL